MYLLRLDDASEYWDKEKWGRMAALLYRYDIKPIFAIIPHNEDDFLFNMQKTKAFGIQWKSGLQRAGFLRCMDIIM